jgi:hypothetical protein
MYYQAAPPPKIFSLVIGYAGRPPSHAFLATAAAALCSSSLTGKIQQQGIL